MHSIHAVIVAFALTVPLPSVAQSGAPASPDTTAPAPKKHGGLFGKVKGLAKSKLVSQVAKVALCTAVPGGQIVAGALEAKKTKNVAGAASTALSGGGGCPMPGLAGMAGGAGAAGMAGGVAGAAAGLAGGVAGGGIPGMPTTGMPGAGMSPAQLKQMQEQYGKMGMNPAQIKGMQAMPGAGVSPEQLKQMEAQYRKMGMKPAQIKAMQQQMQAMQQMMAETSETSDASVTPSSSAQPSATAPAPGAGLPALSKEKGRLVLRQLPWAPGSEGVAEGAGPTFGLAMRDLASAILATSKHYKIEARVEEQGGKAQNRLLSHKRSGAVLAALTAEGIPAARLTLSDGGADKDPRIVVSETK
jgi:hypothetical protein